MINQILDWIWSFEILGWLWFFVIAFGIGFCSWKIHEAGGL